MNKLITLILTLFLLSPAFSQNEAEDYFVPGTPDIKKKDRFSGSISAGTGLVFLGRQTGMTSYVAPRFHYSLTSRFRLNVGFMHYNAGANSRLFMNPQESIVNRSGRPVSGNLVSIGGDYALTKKLIISGAAMVNVNSLRNSGKQDQFKAVGFGMDYKMSESSSIRFETIISSGQGNYQMDPFRSSGFSGSMFGQSSSFGMSPVFR